MQQPSTPVPMDQYGAIAQVAGTYTRTIAGGTTQPAFDWYLMNISRFESADAAIAALPDINADGMAAFQEQWPNTKLVETRLPSAVENASRQIFTGDINTPSGELRYHVTTAVAQVNDVILLLSGYSNWEPTDLATAYPADLVLSLAASNEGADLATYLPPENLLLGGLQVGKE